jgi:hypothetical protein
VKFTVVSKARLGLLQEEVGILRGQLIDARAEISHLKGLLADVAELVNAYNIYEEINDEEDTTGSLIVVDRIAGNGTGAAKPEGPVGSNHHGGSCAEVYGEKHAGPER